MGTVHINYQEVYTRVRKLRSMIEQEHRDTDRRYIDIERTLNRMDGRTNSELQDALEINREKAYVCAGTVLSVLNAMENSARMVEEQERQLANIFNLGGRS